MGPVDQSISAGLGGFFALFLLAAALWLLMRSLLKHLRSAENNFFEEDLRDDAVAAGAVRSRPSRADSAPDSAAAAAMKAPDRAVQREAERPDAGANSGA